MRKLTALISFAALTASTGAFASEGDAVFKKIGCNTCHDLKKDKRPQSQGPSLRQIKKAYKGDRKGLVAFMKKKPGAKARLAEPAYLESIMASQLGRVNTLSDKEFNILVDYMMNGGK